MNTPDPHAAAALLPWYLNGTLAEVERAQVAAYLLERDGELDIAMWRAVQREVRTQPVADPGTELGWRRLRGELRRERQRAIAPGWKIAAAASVLLVIGLQAAILLRNPAAETFRPMSGDPVVPAGAWRVQVRFTDAAPAAGINALLLRLEARVIAGPSALGVYELAIPRAAGEGDAETLAARLRGEPLLQQVVVIR